MPSAPVIRRFEPADASAVEALFVAVNRLLAPPELKQAFERYVAASLDAEMAHIPEYYGSRDGGFWVAEAETPEAEPIAGMFGLERIGPQAMELRRMYVAPTARRRGIAAAMLRFAEDWCRGQGVAELHLSTSELQPAALALYRAAGYRLLREERAEASSNKTIGGGVLRFYLVKSLSGA